MYLFFFLVGKLAANRPKCHRNFTSKSCCHPLHVHTYRVWNEKRLYPLYDTRLDSIWLDSIWFDSIWLDLIWLDSTWFDSIWLNLTQFDLTQLDLTQLDSMLMKFLWLFFQPRHYLYVGTLYLPPTPTLNWLSPLFNVRYAYTRHPSSGSFHFVGSLKHQLRLSFQPAIPVSLFLPSTSSGKKDSLIC